MTEIWETRLGVKMYPPTSVRPYYRLDYLDRAGQRHQYSAGRDRDAAWGRANHVDAELAASAGAQSAKPVYAMCDAWLDDMGPAWSLRHAQTSEVMADKFINPTVGKQPAWTLTKADIADLLRVPPSVSARRHLRAAVGGLLTWGFDNEWLAQPRAMLLPKTPKTASREKAGRAHGESRLHIDRALIPDAEHCKALADAMRAQGGAKYGQQLWLMTAVAASTGVRQGELFALRKGDANFASGTLAVDRQLVRVNGQPAQETPPKWGRVRTTILPALTLWGEPLRAPLLEYLAGKEPGDLMFAAPRGTWWHASNFGKRWLMPARAAVPGWQAGWTWHALRHSFCTALLASGALDTDVALCAGHRDSTTTRAMYVGPTRGATERLNAILA